MERNVYCRSALADQRDLFEHAVLLALQKRKKNFMPQYTFTKISDKKTGHFFYLA